MTDGAPGAALVHSVVAAALADPTRLRGWAQDPTALDRLGIDPATIDIEALARFAGLGEKVRHNLTRAMLPMTFRLLTQLGLDIDLFGAYAVSARNPGRGTPPLARVDALAGFVDDWAGTDTDRTLVRDICRHESALATLRATEPTADPAQPAEAAEPPEPDGGPGFVPRGRLLVRDLTSDPRQLVLVLREQRPRLDTVNRGSWTFVYQREPAGGLRVVQVDAAVGDLLTVLGDGSSVAALAGRLRTRPDDAALLDALAQLAEVGLLTRRE